MTDEVLELLNEIKEGKLETSLKQVLTVKHFYITVILCARVSWR